MSDPDDMPPRELDRLLHGGLSIAAIVEAVAVLAAFVELPFSVVYRLSAGLVVAGLLLVVTGVSGLVHGERPLLQVRVLLSRAWSRVLATLGRVVAIVVGLGLVVLGVMELVAAR